MLNPFGFLLHPLLFLGFCGERGFRVEWVQHRMGADGHRTRAVERANLFSNRCSRPLSAPLLHCGGAILCPDVQPSLCQGRGAILVPRCCRDPCARRLREWCPSNLVPVPAPLAHRTPHVRAQGSAQEKDSRTLPYLHMCGYRGSGP